MNNDDLIWKFGFLAAGAALIGLGVWGLAQGLSVLHRGFLAPTYQAALVYFGTYGRVTVEIFCAVFVIGAGLRFQHKTMTEMTRNLVSYSQKLEETSTVLESRLAKEVENVRTLLAKQKDMEHNFWAVKEQERILRGKAASLQSEIVRLTEPEKVAERERKQAEERAKARLLDHIEVTEWRRA